MLSLSALIATKDRPTVLASTLASIQACEPQPMEVIVIDGDRGRSAQPVVDAARGWPSGVLRYLHTSPGLTLQRNRGIAAARGDILVFLDDDVTIKPDFFSALASAYQDLGVVGATGKVVEDETRRFGRRASTVRRFLFRGTQGTMTSFGYPRRLYDLECDRDVEFMQGCLMSGRRPVVAEVGFDESLPGYGLAEDEDFSYRLSRRGRLRFVPAAELTHKNAGFSSSDPRGLNRTLVVNRTYLFRKNFQSTFRSRIGFAALIAILFAHRIVNREYNGAVGILEGCTQAWRSGR